MQETLTMTVPEAARLIGVSDSAAYEAAARGDIPAVKIGRRVLVKRDAFLAMFSIDSSIDGAPASPG